MTFIRIVVRAIITAILSIIAIALMRTPINAAVGTVMPAEASVWNTNFVFRYLARTFHDLNLLNNSVINFFYYEPHRTI